METASWLTSYLQFAFHFIETDPVISPDARRLATLQDKQQLLISSAMIKIDTAYCLLGERHEVR